MKHIFLIGYLAIYSQLAIAQQYQTKTGTIKFLTSKEDVKKGFENIKAEHRKVVSVMDSKTGVMEFMLLMKGFDFTNDFMENHFNESYAESSKFPKAGFKGNITDIASVNFSKDGTYPVNFIGKLTIKDVTKDISGKGTIEIKGDKIIATTKIKIKPVDYNFKIPATAYGKIADEMDVDISMDYTKK